MKPITNPEIAAAFEAYPASSREGYTAYAMLFHCRTSLVETFGRLSTR